MCGRGGLTFECVAGKSGGEAGAFPCPTEQAARMQRSEIRVFCGLHPEFRCAPAGPRWLQC